MKLWRHDSTGFFWASLSPVFLGIVPIIAKIAYRLGVDVFTVAAVRTIFASLLLWLLFTFSSRRFILSSVPAIASSFLAGSINGFGSLFFYTSLSRIDASLGQLINITYLIFVTLMLRLIGQQVSRLTIGRVILAITAVYLLTSAGISSPDWIGVGFMLVAAFAYATQLVFSQRILYDIPAQTMTLYAMTGMATVVTIAWLAVTPPVGDVPLTGWSTLIFMGLATALARLTMFLGVKKLGSMQTALIGVAEVIISISLAVALLNEYLTQVQWVGALMLLVSILLVKYERDVPQFDWWSLIYRKLSRRKY